MKHKIKILVSDPGSSELGGVFDGNLNQWEDCFFSFGDINLGLQLEQVIAYCWSQEWNVKIECELEKE